MPGIDSYTLDNYGLDGPVGGVMYAKGTFVPGNAVAGLDSSGTSRGIFSRVIVSGLSFRPNRVILRVVYNEAGATIYTTTSMNQPPSSTGSNWNIAYGTSGNNGSTYNMRTYELVGTATNSTYYVNDNGFSIPVNASGIQVEWEAFYIPQ